MKEKLIGLVGLGFWGKNILRNLFEMGVLHTACDLSKQVIHHRRMEFPEVNYSLSFDELLDNPEIKSVVIATPAVTHYAFVKKSLLAGKDVMVEKPLALTVKEGETLVSLAKEKNKILMVGHILYYHPAIVKLKEIVSTGGLGKIQYIYSNRLNIGKLRTEENILWSFAPHDISIILMLLEDDPVAVSSFGGDYLSKGLYDTTLTTLEFKNGVKGHIFVNWLHPYKEQKLIVVGSKAMAVFDDVSDEKLFVYPHKIHWKDGKIPVACKAESRVIKFKNVEPLREELICFTESIRSKINPLTDGQEGLRVLKVLEAAEKSLKSQTSRILFHQEKSFFVHESCYVDADVNIGKGTKIWHFSHILEGSEIGEDCILGQNVAIGPNVKIGDKCKIQNNVSLFNGVTLEEEVFCGPSCVFTNVYNPRAFVERKKEFKKTLVGRGATIGANATIVCGITIGRYTMIGAGSVVKHDIPDFAVVVGVPARQIGWICKCGESLPFKSKYATCSKCGERYKKDSTGKAIIQGESI